MAKNVYTYDDLLPYQKKRTRTEEGTETLESLLGLLKKYQGYRKSKSNEGVFAEALKSGEYDQELDLDESGNLKRALKSRKRYEPSADIAAMMGSGLTKSGEEVDPAYLEALAGQYGYAPEEIRTPPKKLFGFNLGGGKSRKVYRKPSPGASASGSLEAEAIDAINRGADPKAVFAEYLKVKQGG